MRQLEGKQLASGSAAIGMPTNQPAYDPQAQGGAPALQTAAKAYNPAADVVVNGGEKKKDKVSKAL